MNYSSYLKLEALLSLQCPLAKPASEEEHAELFFIIVHQSSELWLKALIAELQGCQRALTASRGLSLAAVQHARRALAAAEMLEVTMTSLRCLDSAAFLAFRDQLGTASGAQSPQFLELRRLIGLGSKDGSTIERCLREMRRCQRREESALDPLEEGDFVQLRSFTMCLLDIASAIWRWGVHHLDVVTRTIGNRPGTGGSTGASFLATHLFERPFPTLWNLEDEPRETPAALALS